MEALEASGEALGAARVAEPFETEAMEGVDALEVLEALEGVEALEGALEGVDAFAELRGKARGEEARSEGLTE